MSLRLAVRQPSPCLRGTRHITTPSDSRIKSPYHVPSSEQKTIIRRENSLDFAYTANSKWATGNRNLLRAILRECTYLPDTNARRFWKYMVLDRFRTVATKAHARRDDPDFGDRIYNARRDARRALSRLQRANEGDRKVLRMILLWTYGRVGRRRYALMEPLMPVEVRKDVRDLSNEALDVDHDEENNLERDHEPLELDEKAWKALRAQHGRDAAIIDNVLQSKADPTLPTLSQKVLDLAKSQKQHSPPNLTRPKLRQLQPVIPALNNRLLPMPQKRVKNMTKKWYATLLDRLLPPLPVAEWRELQSRAVDGHPTDIKAVRRAQQVRTPKTHFGGHSALDAIVRQGRIDTKSFANKEGHNITPRFMQRLWAEVFSQCPLMTYNEEQKKWDVIWGHQAMCRTDRNQEARSES